MKYSPKFIFILCVWMCSAVYSNGQNIGINEDGTIPDASAILDIKSNDKGLLVPRMSTTQRGMITTPAQGLLVYDQTTGSFWFYNSGWVELKSGTERWDETAGNVHRNTGNVGINTSTPTNLLNLNNSSLGDVAIEFDGRKSTTINSVRLSTDNTGVNINSGAAGSWFGTPNAAAAPGGAFWTGGLVDWSNPERSDILRLTFTNFSGTFPAGATITGLRLEVRRRASDTNDIEDHLIRLVRYGAGVGVNKAAFPTWPQNFQNYNYGGPTDLWGAGAITPAVINANGLGVDIQYREDIPFTGADERGYVDFVRMNVFYSAPGVNAGTVWSIGTLDGEFKVNHANTLAGTPAISIDEADVTRLSGLRMPTGAALGSVLTSDGVGTASWQTTDGDATNELQNLTFTGTTLGISSGNSFDLASISPWTTNGLNIINSNTGNVGIGNPTPNALLHVGTTTGARIRFGNAEYIEDGGGLLITLNGGIQSSVDAVDNIGSATRRWNTVYATNGTINTSDRRDKTNIRPLDYGLSEVMALTPVRFNWKSEAAGNDKLGLIAQDLQGVLPEVVKDWDWSSTGDTREAREKITAERLGVYYSDIIPVLIKAIQEQQAQIEELKAKVSLSGE